MLADCTKLNEILLGRLSIVARRSCWRKKSGCGVGPLVATPRRTMTHGLVMILESRWRNQNELQRRSLEVRRDEPYVSECIRW